MSLIHYEVHGDIAVATLRNPPVNALSGLLRVELFKALQHAEDNAGVKAVVLRGENAAFSAGADIREMGTANARIEPSVRALHDHIERMRTLTVAAISGSALGGGLELALACDARIADASAQFGLPEVKLGILPGAGGTQRLPHLVGCEIALDLLTSGRLVTAQEALVLGIVDALLPDLRDAGLEYTRRILLQTPQERSANISAHRSAQAELFERRREEIAASAPGFAAPLAIIDCVEAAVFRGPDEGLALELTKLAELRRNPQHKALRHLFLAERKARKGVIDADSAAAPGPMCDAIPIIERWTEDSAPDLVAIKLDTPVTTSALVHVIHGDRAAPQRLAEAAAIARRRALPVVFTQSGDPFETMWKRYVEAAHLLEREGVSAKRINTVACGFGMKAPSYPVETSAPAHDDSAAPGLSDDAILQRLIRPVVAEGARAIERGWVACASDIDVAWVHGYGFPAYHGGPMYWSAQQDQAKSCADEAPLAAPVGQA